MSDAPPSQQAQQAQQAQEAPGAPSTCDEVAELLAVAVDQPLPSRLEGHLEGCATCLALLDEASRLCDAIRDAGDQYHHAGDFESRLLAKIESSLPPPPLPRPPSGANV